MSAAGSQASARARATITVSVTDRNTGEERQTQMLVYVTSKL